MMAKIIHKELSYLVNGCIFDVHNEVGPGFREECYQKALEIRLTEEGIGFQSKPATRSELVFLDTKITAFEPDLVIPEKMILELKHQSNGLSSENMAQVLSYLKHWNLPLGLLVNFAMDKAIIERIPFVAIQAEVDENYDHLSGILNDDSRTLLSKVRGVVMEINEQIGPGYATPTYRKLVHVGLRAYGLDCDEYVDVSPSFRGRPLPDSWISPLVVGGRLCVQVEAVRDDVSARAIRTMQTHLKWTGCPLGLVVCFGKTKLVVRGVKPYAWRS